MSLSYHFFLFGWHHLLSIYYTPGNVLGTSSTLCVLVLVLITTLYVGFIVSYLKEGETESQRG